MNMVTFKHTCKSCGHYFYAPVKSDFEYGVLILPSVSGKYYAYLDVIQDIVFKEVENLIKTDHLEDLIDFWDIFPSASDPAIDGTLYKNITKPCPKCKAKDSLLVDINDRGVNQDVPILTHNGWNILSIEEKSARIKTIAKTNRPQASQ